MSDSGLAGHIAISVDDIQAACERFERLGVRFQKRLTDGKMKNIAFILDPDGYVAQSLLAYTLLLKAFYRLGTGSRSFPRTLAK